MRIVVISLSTAHERRAAIIEQFAQAGLQFEFCAAFTAETQPIQAIDVDQQRCYRNMGRYLTPTELACFASHRRVWLQAVQTNETCIVFEDDIALLPDFLSCLPFLEQVSDHYGFIRLETKPGRRQKTVYEGKDFQLRRMYRCPWSAAAYCISPATAAGFLERSTPVYGPVDLFFKHYWLHGQAIYRIEPDVVRLSALSAFTTISDRPEIRLSSSKRLKRQFYKLQLFYRRAVFNMLHQPENSQQARSPTGLFLDKRVHNTTESQRSIAPNR